MQARSIRVRRKRKTIQQGFELNIVPLLDIMVILLVFLLKAATISSSTLQAASGLQLARSLSKEVPRDSHHLVITPLFMAFENEKVLDFVVSSEEVEAEDYQPQFKLGPNMLDRKERKLIIPLYDALIQAKEKSDLIREKARFRDEDGNPLPFNGHLAVQADRRIEYDLLRKIMYTAGAAGYRVFHFLAQRKEQ